MERPLVIYHDKCADGFTAAWCFHHMYGAGECDFHPGVYGEDPPGAAGRDVYLVDFSYPRQVVLGMAAVANKVVIIDHHKTAIDALQGIEAEASTVGGSVYTYFDLDHSGAMLTWKYLFGELPPPQMLRHVEDRDLWRFALLGTRELMACLFSYDYTFDNWDRLMLADEAYLQQMEVEGKAIERKHFKDIHELLALTRRRMTIGDYDVPVASLPYTQASDAANIMAEGEPFAACYYDSAGWRVFSLRSKEGGIDVSEVAKRYGGGGHKHAAGFRVPRDHVLARA